MNILLLWFAGLFFLCFWLTSCLETHALGLESILTVFGSHLLIGMLNRNFIKRISWRFFFSFQFTFNSVCLFYNYCRIRNSEMDWCSFSLALPDVKSVLYCTLSLLLSVAVWLILTERSICSLALCPGLLLAMTLTLTATDPRIFTILDTYHTHTHECA